VQELSKKESNCNCDKRAIHAVYPIDFVQDKCDILDSYKVGEVKYLSISG
jgi:hypothetical protein